MNGNIKILTEKNREACSDRKVFELNIDAVDGWVYVSNTHLGMCCLIKLIIQNIN